MSKKSPTLADALIRETFSDFSQEIDPKNTFRNDLLHARKFYLDDEMSSFMADLAYAPLGVLTEKNRVRTHRQLDAWRISARLPHTLTWIEYNNKIRNNRIETEYKEQQMFSADTPDQPARLGWLLKQHPSIETAFMAIPCTSHSIGEGAKYDDPLVPLPTPELHGWVWRTDSNVPLPYPLLDHSANVLSNGAQAGYLSGILSYRSLDVGCIGNPYLLEGGPKYRKIVLSKMEKVLAETLMEKAGDLRYLWSLLAMINDVPTTIENVRPSKGYVAKGQYRRFMEHNIIRLKVPQKLSLRSLAQRVNRLSRRRAHQVRGHWRRDWRNAEGRIWVKEHQRGDASLGFVLHDYSVEKDHA